MHIHIYGSLTISQPLSQDHVLYLNKHFYLLLLDTHSHQSIKMTAYTVTRATIYFIWRWRRFLQYNSILWVTPSHKASAWGPSIRLWRWSLYGYTCIVFHDTLSKEVLMCCCTLRLSHTCPLCDPCLISCLSLSYLPPGRRKFRYVRHLNALCQSVPQPFRTIKFQEIGRAGFAPPLSKIQDLPGAAALSCQILCCSQKSVLPRTLSPFCSSGVWKCPSSP